MKKNFIKWLFTKTSPYSEITNKELIDILFFHINNFIDYNNLELIIEKEELLINFYLFNYGYTIENTNNEYFDMMFHEDIVDMFILFKNISKSYDSSMYSSKGDTADNLLNFLNKYIVSEYDYETIEDIDELIIEDEY